MFGLAETVALNRNASIRELEERVERIKGYIEKCTTTLEQDLTTVREFWYDKLVETKREIRGIKWETRKHTVDLDERRCCVCGKDIVTFCVSREITSRNLICDPCATWAIDTLAHTHVFISGCWDSVLRERF